MKRNKYLPFISVSSQTTFSNFTGSWRTQRPVWERKLSPCQNACPAGSNIPRWLRQIHKGKFKQAWEILIETNPLPAVCSSVCPHPCEAACNRSQFDQSLLINALEKFLGREALKKKWLPGSLKASLGNEKVAVIGSGPAGLSCAYYLAQRGYKVAVYEALPEIGGMLRVGIPSYRLSRDLLADELAHMFFGRNSPGEIAIFTNYRIDRERFKMLEENFDAIFAATGVHKSKRLNIPGEDLEGVISGLDFLKKINLGEKIEIGNKVVVIGGGNTAIDTARSAQHLGSDVSLVYRRTKADMPAFQEEVKTAEKEGIKFYFLAKPTRIVLLDNGKKRLELVEGKVVGKDEDGRNKISFPKGGFDFQILADTVITAIGEEPDLSFLPETLPENVFIGGDAKDMAGTVAAAIRSGRQAAEKIHLYLTTGQKPSMAEYPALQIVQFKDLNLDYLKHLPRQSRIDKKTAKKEAERCFSCGECNLCQNCQIFCPDVAVFEKNGQIQINYDYCKGCGICAEECPTKAMTLSLEGRE